MKVLFIGGTGIISSACSGLAAERGIDLYLLNRGKTLRPVPAKAKILKGDIREAASARQAIGDLKFDAVVDWVAFTPEHIDADLKLFRGRTNHRPVSRALQSIYFHQFGLRLSNPARKPSRHRIHAAR